MEINFDRNIPGFGKLLVTTTLTPNLNKQEARTKYEMKEKHDEAIRNKVQISKLKILSNEFPEKDTLVLRRVE